MALVVLVGGGQRGAGEWATEGRGRMTTGMVWGPYFRCWGPEGPCTCPESPESGVFGGAQGWGRGGGKGRAESGWGEAVGLPLGPRGL